MKAFLKIFSIIFLSICHVKSQNLYAEYVEDNKFDDSVCAGGKLYVPNTNDCAKFIRCDRNNLKIDSYFKCNEGYLYDIFGGCVPLIETACKYGPYATTPKSVTVNDVDAYKYGCRESNQGRFLSHPTDCSKYIKCTLFGANIYTCLSNEKFNLDNQKCEANGNCVIPQNHPYTYLSSIPSETIRQCLNYGNNYTAGYYNSRGRLCNYLICGDEPKLGECIEYAFNATSRLCDSTVTCSATINQIGFIAILIITLVNLIF